MASDDFFKANLEILKSKRSDATINPGVTTNKKNIKLSEPPKSYVKMRKVKKGKASVAAKIVGGIIVGFLVIYGSINLIKDSDNIKEKIAHAQSLFSYNHGKHDSNSEFSTMESEGSVDFQANELDSELSVLESNENVNIQDEESNIEFSTLNSDEFEDDNYQYDNNDNVIFEVGTSSDIEDTQFFLDNTIEGYLIKYYSEMYGVDPNIVAAVCYQESGGVNLTNVGSATGIMMLENMDDYEITVYNYKEQAFETIVVSSSHTGDLEYNIRCGIANLRNKIDYFEGNIYAALQAYNYSEYTLDMVFATEGIKLDGYSDYSWLYITEEVTNNPQKYGISYIDENGEEKFKTYGVSYYPKYTGIHLVNPIIKYKYKDKEIEMNYATATVLNVNEIEYSAGRQM